MKKLIFSIASLAIVFASCSDDDDSATPSVDDNITTAAVLSGGPYTFCQGDGEADIVDVSVTDAGVGTYNTFVITDEQGNVLGLPPALANIPDFDGEGEGVCLIWHLNYEGDPETYFEGVTNASELSGDFSLSNSITVNRLTCVTEAATLTGGPYDFCVDGIEDRVTDVMITDAGSGSLNMFVITDEDLNILGTPPDLDALAAGPEFDSAGVGVCLIWHLNYEEGALDNLDATTPNASQLTGDFSLSNSLQVNRTQPVAGVISGGTDNVYTFTVGDGMEDLATDLAIDGSTSVGTGSTWIITKGDGEILGLPATIDMVKANNFDGVEAGTCLIWYMRYEGTLADIGAITGANATTDLTGCYALSNEVTVNRMAAVML